MHDLVLKLCQLAVPHADNFKDMKRYDVQVHKQTSWLRKKKEAKEDIDAQTSDLWIP